MCRPSSDLLAPLALEKAAPVERAKLRMSVEARWNAPVLVVRIFVENDTDAIATVDAYPVVRRAVVHRSSGEVEELPLPVPMRPISRMGSGHWWVGVMPGERKSVAKIILEPGRKLVDTLSGCLEMTLELTKADGAITLTSTTTLLPRG